jgi:hypothetical protein
MESKASDQQEWEPPTDGQATVVTMRCRVQTPSSPFGHAADVLGGTEVVVPLSGTPLGILQVVLYLRLAYEGCIEV